LFADKGSGMTDHLRFILGVADVQVRAALLPLLEPSSGITVHVAPSPHVFAALPDLDALILLPEPLYAIYGGRRDATGSLDIIQSTAHPDPRGRTWYPSSPIVPPWVVALVGVRYPPAIPGLRTRSAEQSYAGFRAMFARIAAFNQSGETSPIHRLGWWRPGVFDADTIRGLVRAYEDHQHDRSPFPSV
jgi:hypothetical protein